MKNRQSFLNRMRFLNKKIFNRVTLRVAWITFSRQVDPADRGRTAFQTNEFYQGDR